MPRHRMAFVNLKAVSRCSKSEELLVVCRDQRVTYVMVVETRRRVTDQPSKANRCPVTDVLRSNAKEVGLYPVSRGYLGRERYAEIFISLR